MSTTTRSGLLIAGLACGCWSGQPAAPPRRPPAPAAPVVASCAIDPPAREPAGARLLGWPGQIGDRSWVVLDRVGDGPAVAGLGPGGALVVLPIDRRPHAIYADGAALWLAWPAAVIGAPEIELTAVDLGGPLPVRSGGERLPFASLHGVAAFAVSATRALVADLGPDVRLQLYDRVQGRHGAPGPGGPPPDAPPAVPVGAPVVIASSALAPPVLRCAGDRCFALGVLGDGPGRRLFVERFAPDGGHAHEELARDHLAEHRLAQAGGRWFAVWTAFDEPGVFVRELDAGGRPVTPRTRIFAGRIAGLEIVPDPRRLQIAARTKGGWVIGQLDPRELGAPRPGVGPAMRVVPTGLPKQAFFLTGAALPDGVLLAGFSSSVDYTGGFHTWSGEAWATFLGTGAAPAPAWQVSAQGGDGRSGLGAFPLVGPGRAAVLVVQRGPEAEVGGELVVLRRPCR